MPEHPEELKRWRPMRAGIRNIWEYDNQEFTFAGGRLVLRGPNGSGKSNALALLVPFLLDGVMSSSRMDSLGGGRSMRTLLLCLSDDDRPNQFRHDQRTGYVWLEFARGAGGGTARTTEYVTIGCGARASTQRDADAWFFVTDRRPGIDLELAPGGVPLARGALVEALGAAAVFDSAESYRSAVDRTLFVLGDHRYHNLVELLLVLRRPHLAGRLSLELMSRALSDGLAGLDDRLIADVAASFEDLEAVQRDLRDLLDAHGSVQVFLPVYRRYLRAAAHLRASAVTDAGGLLAAARRRETHAERTLVALSEEAERNRLAGLESERQRQVADQRRRAVFESTAYRDAASLAEVEEHAADLERALSQAEERLGASRREHAAALTELTDAETAVETRRRAVDEGFDAAASSADRAGVAWPVGRDQVQHSDLGPVARGLADRRRQDVAAVRSALREAERAGDVAAQAARSAALAEDASEQADVARGEAADALDSARSDLAGEITGWVVASGIDELAGMPALAALVGEPDAPSLADALSAALRPRRDGLAVMRASALDLVARLTHEHGDLVQERTRVAADPMPAPDPLATRPADRAGRRGAPLYACCDFGPDVDEADRAGFEAALEAAGLLDAWVGEEHDASDALDAWLRPGPPSDGPTLADVLVVTPPSDAEVDEGTVHAVLASISLSEAGVSVLPDGRFQLGPLHGRFAKERAELVGASAREERRRRLLAELDAKIAEVEGRLAEAEREGAAATTELDRLDGLAASMASATPALAARDELHAAVTRARLARETAERARGEAQVTRTRAREQTDRLRSVAGEHRLPVTDEELTVAADRVHRFEQLAAALAAAVVDLAGRRRQCEQAGGRVERALGALDVRERERDDLSAQAAGLRARAAQLRTQLGADAQAPLRELAALDHELAGLRNDVDELGRQMADLAERRGRSLQDKEDAAFAVADLERDAAERAARLEVLRRADVWEVVGTAVVGTGGPIPAGREATDGSAPDAAAPADPVALATAVVAATGDVTAEPDDNALQRSFRQLLDELSRGYDPGLSYVDGIAVVEVTAEVGTFSVLRLDRELTDRVARQRELLSDRDREIFERHLLSLVAHALRDLLNDADELVERINRTLADRPTASGKSVQLRWEPDTVDPVVRSALVLLRRTPELLGPDERDQLRRFFQTAIAQERAEYPALGYAEVLRRVLDYRAWHAFVPMVRSAGGGIQRLTRTLFRSLSGGEQAVVLHLPLFAAAAAHYDASLTAPRLIALDEAFAGIDEGMRAELMGLLVRFDLDVVLTGHELWGAYAQVPALMVYDLLRQPPLEGVSAVAVRWDGAVMAEA